MKETIFKGGITPLLSGYDAIQMVRPCSLFLFQVFHHKMWESIPVVVNFFMNLTTISASESQIWNAFCSVLKTRMIEIHVSDTFSGSNLKSQFVQLSWKMQ